LYESAVVQRGTITIIFITDRISRHVSRDIRIRLQANDAVYIRAKVVFVIQS
jgi:hypothetical protein